MVKLFLAEDEIAMREGIKRHIHWAEEGIEFCGEAGDGELAWPLIREKRPDIVITDIKMPFMDGLQLSALIRKELPETKIVILSGYSEFEYAQEALRLGVTEYLLKPITPRNLREVIRKLAASIEEQKKEQEERIDWMQEEQREKRVQDQRKLFRALITENTPASRILALAENMNLDLIKPFYQILLIYVSYKSDYRQQSLVEGLLMTIADCFEGCYLFEHGVDSMALLLTGNTEEELTYKLDEIRERVKLSIRSLDDLHYFLSLGRPVRHLGEICEAYHEANRVSSYRFFLPPDQVVTADSSIGQLMTENNSNPINTDTALQNGNLRNIWENFLRTGTTEEIDGFVDDVFASVGEDNLQSLLFLSYLTMDCYFSMARFAKEIGKSSEEISRSVGDINTVIGAIQSSSDARKYLTGYLKEVITLRDGSTLKKNNQILRSAVEYIDEHFTDGEMSLNTAASAAGLSPNRFSTLFSHEMGMTFIEYLIKKRMAKACELLMTTDLRSSEIAYQSGYNDPHYFSSTFKKIHGISPREYRRRGLHHEETGEE